MKQNKAKAELVDLLLIPIITFCYSRTGNTEFVNRFIGTWIEGSSHGEKH